MRIPVNEFRPQFDRVQQLEKSTVALLPVELRQMNEWRLQDFANCQARVEGTDGVLEHILHRASLELRAAVCLRTGIALINFDYPNRGVRKANKHLCKRR